MLHHESWKPIYFGVNRSNAKVMSHKNSADMGLCTLRTGVLASSSYNLQLQQ